MKRPLAVRCSQGVLPCGNVWTLTQGPMITEKPWKSLQRQCPPQPETTLRGDCHPKKGPIAWWKWVLDLVSPITNIACLKITWKSHHIAPFWFVWWYVIWQHRETFLFDVFVCVVKDLLCSVHVSMSQTAQRFMHTNWKRRMRLTSRDHRNDAQIDSDRLCCICDNYRHVVSLIVRNAHTGRKQKRFQWQVYCGLRQNGWGLACFVQGQRLWMNWQSVTDFGSSSEYQLFAAPFEEMLSWSTSVWDILFPPHETPSQGVPFQYVHNDQLISATDLGLKEVEFETRPFSCGKFRAAYKGKVYFEACWSDRSSQSLKQLLSCWDFTKKRPSYPCIVKAFKSGHARHPQDWTKDLEVLKVAQSYSQKFNEAGIAPVNIDFASAFLYQVSATGFVTGPRVCPKRNHREAKVQSKEKVCVEPFLTGKFVKANSNFGFVAKHGDKTAEFFKVAQAFSHWTWVESEKSLLVCDLQGVFQTSEGEKKWAIYWSSHPLFSCEAAFWPDWSWPAGHQCLFLLPRLQWILLSPSPPIRCDWRCTSSSCSSHYFFFWVDASFYSCSFPTNLCQNPGSWAFWNLLRPSRSHRCARGWAAHCRPRTWGAPYDGPAHRW